MAKKVDPRIKHIKYACTRCGASQPRAKLTVKRAEFASMGERFKVLKRRTTDWLCATCRDADPDWNRPAHGSSPGMANTKVGPDHDG